MLYKYQVGSVRPQRIRLADEPRQDVTLEQVLAALRKYVLPVFEPATSVAAVTASPSVAEKVAEGLKTAGYEVETRLWDAGEDDVDMHSDCDTCESGSSGSS